MTVKEFFRLHSFDLLAVLSVLVLSGSALVYYALPKNEDLIASVFVEKVLLVTYDLSKETTERTIEIEGKYTPMTLGIKKNAIAVLESGCKSQYCVHQGYVSAANHPIVCSYNEVYIALTGKEPVNSVVAGITVL